MLSFYVNGLLWQPTRAGQQVIYAFWIILPRKPSFWPLEPVAEEEEEYQLELLDLL
jgi:hypothetical protein